MMEDTSEIVKKPYYCNICKKQHYVEFPSNFAEGRTHYPFVYFFIHKYEGEIKNNFNKVGADIITTMYIDRNLAIRGAEVAFEDSGTNIMSKTDAQTMITFLTQHINELQEAYDLLLEKYSNLLKSM